MKQQMATRLGVAHVRDTVMQFVAGEITREQAMESLRVGRSRLYDLRTSYLAARAEGRGDTWAPGLSGGNHMPAWPGRVQAFLRKALSPAGDAKRYSYAFAASEAGRRFGTPLDRPQVRRWQRKSVGELWQLDATPDRFLGKSNPPLTLIDMIDDCSRVQVGGRLCARETAASYLDLFRRAFNRFGLPLEIYVDKASFFRNDDGSLTQLGRRLKFLDVSFVFANSPEAKGKVERVHQVWQDRLPAYAAREGVTADTPLDDVNEHFACLVDYRNAFETHRDLGGVPLEAWDRAVKEGRCKIRQPPRDGWWELLWSEWKGVVIDPRGRLLVGNTLCTTECANGTRAWRCLHLDGTVSLVLDKPERGVSPKVVFTNTPEVRKPVILVPDLAPRAAKR